MIFQKHIHNVLLKKMKEEKVLFHLRKIRTKIVNLKKKKIPYPVKKNQKKILIIKIIKMILMNLKRIQNLMQIWLKNIIKYPSY